VLHLKIRFVASLVALVIAALVLVAPAAAQDPNLRKVSAGEKLELKGVVLTRDGDHFTLREMGRTDTVVLLTDSTSIKTEKKGAFRKGKDYDVTAILPGLILSVEGQGDSEGRLAADKIRFSEDDLHAAITASVRVAPVEQTANEAKAGVAATNERISSLDEWEEAGLVSVTFATNSSTLAPEARKVLDDLAAKAPGAKNYKVEITGHTDSTGNLQKNLALSRQRADAVVQYLAVKHKIPLRRMETPMGYAATQTVADDTTAEGRAQNRRVDIRVFVNKGLKNAPE
jgi:OOP family OmpA-OmpF porin